MATRLKMKAKRTLKGDDKGGDKSVDDHDTSILTKPLTTSINNLLKVISLYQNASEEIRQYLTSECDILYECRVCRSIFRSLSNFILHKRKFCQEKFSCVTYSKWFNNDDDYLDIIQQESCKDSDEVKPPKKNLNAVIDNLIQKKQTDLEIEKLFSNEFKENQELELNINDTKKLNLESIPDSNSGVFQTLHTENTSKTQEETMKLEIMEMYRLTEGQTAILGPDGKVASQKSVTGLKVLESNDSTSLTCPKCNINFSTRKTLLSHIKYKHESERIVYPCLECSETFATVWSVYRHLYNIHHKTLAEVRKLRSKIKAKAVKNESPVDKKNDQSTLNDQQKIDEENQQWMDNFESDNDIQMCGGCGRRFERKAALNSHSQTCQKRINARNLINVNKQKRIAALEEKSIEKKNPPPKLIRLDLEAEKKFMENKKINSAKRRKIGIQIRYDYTKCDKNVPSPAVLPIITEEEKKISVSEKEETSQNTQSSDQSAVKSSENSSKTDVNSDSNRLNLSIDADLDSEVVSIPSSNSSPCKEEQDPLFLKDNTESDCEIEEILCPLEHSIFGPPKPEDIKNEDFDDVHDQYKVASINESTLKLIKLINSDIPAENLRPSLDEKMANYVNIKKLKCIPCDAKYGNISKLRHHMASHFNWNRFRCDICIFKAYDKIDVFEHIKRDHSIIEFEKIEAVILQIPEWETIELSSDVFLVKDEIELIDCDKKEESDKRGRESSLSSSPDCSIILDDNEEKDVKKQIPILKPKKKLKVIKLNNTEHVTADSVTEVIPKDPLSDTPSEDSRSESRSSNRSNQDPELKKMVYEVIFGNDVTITKATVSNTVSGEERDSVHVVPNDVSNVISRPVRNRVKPLLYKDFIYDLHGFKEHHKTVLESNINHKTTPLVSNISESLEDSIKKTNNIRLTKSLTKSNKSSFGDMGNTESNLNLQKTAISFPDNQILGDDYPQTVVSIVDPQAMLNDSTTQSDGDDDIYIIENEELVAVK